MSEHARTLPRRPLGACGENVSALGLGLGPLARSGPGAPWRETVDAAIQAGITSFDAAQGAERPASEERLGELLKDQRDALFLSTRCSPLDGRALKMTADAARSQLEDSLQRLRTDRIDLYHAHDVEASGRRRVVEETLPALIEARERGDIRYVGASGGSLELLHEIVVTFAVDAVLSYARLDLVNAELLDTVLPAAAERGIAVINASPLHMGVLSDPRVTERGLQENEPLAVAAERAFEIATERGVELPALALQFAAAEERVATTIVGCRTPAEVSANVAAFLEEPKEYETSAIQAIRDVFGAGGVRAGH